MQIRSPRFSVLVSLLAVAVGLAGAGGASARLSILPTLYVKYALNCTFTITDDNGARVTSLAAGSYNVEVTSPEQFNNGTDRSGLSPNDFSDCKGKADFHLTGPGVDYATTLDDGSNDHALTTETFKAGSSYVALDGNQPSVARVTFTASASSAPPPAPSSSAYGTGTKTTSSKSTSVVGSQTVKVDPFRGTLAGAVSAGGKLTLTSQGKAVAKLRSGRYTFSVVDGSRSSAFVVQQIRKSAKTITAGPYTGKKSVTIDLKPGQWFFYSSFVGAKNYFIVVG